MNKTSQPEVVFGYILKTLRLKNKLSQEKLAEICDLDRTFISLLERGKRQPTLKTIINISRALEISSEELVGLVSKKMKQANRLDIK